MCTQYDLKKNCLKYIVYFNMLKFSKLYANFKFKNKILLMLKTIFTNIMSYMEHRDYLVFLWEKPQTQ